MDTFRRLNVIKLVDGMLTLRGNGSSGVFSTSFKWVFQYTTSAAKANSSNFMVDFLVNSLGFSKEEAIATSSKVSCFKSAENLDSVVDYLKQSGLDKTQIKNVVISCPKIMSRRFDETLKPKLKAFQDLGFSGSDLADLISVNRRVWGLNLNTHILPAIELLKAVITSDENLLRALKKSPWFLWNSVLKYLPLNVALLQSYGLSATTIEELLLEKPRYFVMESKWLEAVLIKVEETLRIPRSSPMFSRVVSVVSSLSEKTLESKVELYRSFGWTESDILWLVKTNPRCLTFSEDTIRRKLNFFMKDLGCDLAQIVARPIVLNYSIEKRVIPRSAVLEVLKDKGLVKSTYGFFSCLTMSESQFLGRFLLPFQEEVHNLYENYMKSTGSPLQAAK